MKTMFCILAGASSLASALAQQPPPAAAPTPKQEYVYEQKPLGGRQPLVRPEQATAVVDKFKTAYAKLGSPRLLIYVNRELVDEQTGLKVIARTEKTDLTRNTTTSDSQEAQVQSGKGRSSQETEKTTYENRYRNTERKEATLADRQTVRDIERLFGRPLRTAGASLADQQIATQLMGSRDIRALGGENEQARKDREALSKIADVAIEVLISSRNVHVAEVSGDKTYSVPDIQATAIQLKDARILGQASSSDVTSAQHPSYYARNFDVREIAEATALALMEDMLTGVDQSAKAQ